MSLDGRFSQLEYVKQKQLALQFSIEHSKDVQEYCYRWKLIRRTSCNCEQLQLVLANVETIEEVEVRRPGQDEEELRDEVIVIQSSEIHRAVSVTQ